MGTAAAGKTGQRGVPRLADRRSGKTGQRGVPRLRDPARDEAALQRQPCAPFLDFIELSLSKGRNAKAIWQDLVDNHGFTGRYASVKRFVRPSAGPRGSRRAVIVTPPGEDYGESRVMVSTRWRPAFGASAVALVLVSPAT